jgi:hypothetical protein
VRGSVGWTEFGLYWTFSVGCSATAHNELQLKKGEGALARFRLRAKQQVFLVYFGEVFWCVLVCFGEVFWCVLVKCFGEHHVIWW